MVHDADVAATLLNRWQAKSGPLEGTASSYDLLREGGLEFTLVRGLLGHGDDSCDGMEVECLSFKDGSRALRLVRTRPAHDLTRWAALGPLGKLTGSLLGK